MGKKNTILKSDKITLRKADRSTLKKTYFNNRFTKIAVEETTEVAPNKYYLFNNKYNEQTTVQK